MIIERFFRIKPKNYFNKDLVKLKFDFKIVSVPETLEQDEKFPYDDEIFLVNVGELGKFESDKIYQSKFVVLKEGEFLHFNGYAPDFGRKSDIIENVDGNFNFKIGEIYHVEMLMSKYRVYIDINNGYAKTSYGNGRMEISDVAFYVRNGVVAEIDEKTVCFEESDNEKWEIDIGVQEIIDKGIACNYLFWHNAPDGVYFDRISVEQNILCTTRNSPAYQSNVQLDMYTDAKELVLTIEITDIPFHEWQVEFGFILNGERQNTVKILGRKNKEFELKFILPEKSPNNNRWTIVFPTSVAVALKKFEYTQGAIIKKVEKTGYAYFFGDSITEGAECEDPSAHYVNQVTNAYNLYSIDQAVSGRTFCDYTVLGEYPYPAKYVFIANGTNNFCGGIADKSLALEELEKGMLIVIERVLENFKNAKIIALLPIWRSDEKGVNFSLKDISDKMREIYARYPKIYVIDAHPFIPFDASYFSNSELALHPNTEGHNLYGEKLLQELKNIM